MPNKLSQRYRAARSDLFIIVALTGVNILLGLAESGTSFLFSAFFPQVAVAWAQYGFLGLEGFACIALYALLPTAFVFLCAMMAKKDQTWVWTAMILFILDTLYLFWFVFAYDAAPSDFLLEIAFHVLILIPLLRGAVAGSKLNKMGVNIEQVAASPVPPVQQNAVFAYDAAFAKMRGAVKTGKYIAVIGGFVVMLFCACLCVIPLLELLSVGAAMFIMLGLVIGVTVIFIIILAGFNPFIWASRSYAYLNEAGQLCYMRGNACVVLQDFCVEHAYEDRYELTYTAVGGKRKKYVIANAYPQLEAWLDAQRTK